MEREESGERVMGLRLPGLMMLRQLTRLIILSGSEEGPYVCVCAD